MPISDELYKDIILEHYENPRHFGKLPVCTRHESGVNPLCGDEIELYLELDEGLIKDVSFEGKGCSISQASASMMVEAILGKTVMEAQEILTRFKSMLLEDQNPEFDESLEDLNALEGVKKYPVRVKCAVLPWNTLEKAVRLG